MKPHQAEIGMFVVLNDRTDATVYRVTRVGLPGWPLLLEIVDDDVPHATPQIIDVSMARQLNPSQRRAFNDAVDTAINKVLKPR